MKPRARHPIERDRRKGFRRQPQRALVSIVREAALRIAMRNTWRPRSPPRVVTVEEAQYCAGTTHQVVRGATTKNNHAPWQPKITRHATTEPQCRTTARVVRTPRGARRNCAKYPAQALFPARVLSLILPR